MYEDEGKSTLQNCNHISFMQCAGCQSPIISNLLCTIRDSVIIIHSPLGCASSFIDFNLKFKMGLKKRGLPVEDAKFVSSNITESDVIFDVDKKLKDAVDKSMEKFKPKVIFITSSCGSGITALDIQNVVDYIQDQYTVPLIIITCELYNSKAWSSGFNSKRSENLNKLIKNTDKNEKFYNVINFTGNDDIKDLLDKIPVSWNYISSYSDYECLEKMGGALGTLLISTDRFSRFIADWLKEEFHIPRINKTMPYGIEATDKFFHEINTWFKEKFSIHHIISNDRQKYTEKLEKIKEKLNCIRCLPIIMGYGYEKSVLSMLKDLDVDIMEGDSNYQMIFDNSNMPFLKKDAVGKLYGLQGVKLSFNQAYMLINFINHVNPDLVIVKHYSLRAWTVKMGISTLWIEDELEFYGYKGMLQFAQKLLDLISNNNFVKNIKRHSKLPYKEWWMKENLIKKV
jgi:nitrogenase molybdenum-iron protein alpha chain